MPLYCHGVNIIFGLKIFTNIKNIYINLGQKSTSQYILKNYHKINVKTTKNIDSNGS